MSSDLVAFIKARLSEDKQVARECLDNALDTGEWDVEDWHLKRLPRIKRRDTTYTVVEAVGDEAGVHIARNDPARVLREVEAKRLILTEHHAHSGPWYPDHCIGCGYEKQSYGGDPYSPRIDECPTLRALALCWSDHPDYRPEWSPA